MPNLDLTKYGNQFDQLLKTPEQMQSLKGVPKKQTTEQENLFYWYGSVVPHKAELYRFENDKVVWTSIDVTADKISVQDFVEVLGEPEYSVKRYSEVNDSLQNKVVAWPSKGYALIASGNDQYAQVTRLEFFQPETLEQYLTNWGKDYADKESVNLIITPTPYPIEVITTIPPINQNTSILAYTQIRNELILLCLVTGFIIVFSLLTWRRNRINN